MSDYSDWEKQDYRELWWCDPEGKPVKKADGIVPLLIDLEKLLADPETRETIRRLLVETGDSPPPLEGHHTFRDVCLDDEPDRILMRDIDRTPPAPRWKLRLTALWTRMSRQR